MKQSEPHEATLLVVDDNPENIAIVTGLFSKEYSIKAATTGEKAIHIVRNGNPPDLILLDIVMPGMDGYEVAQKIKQNAKTKEIPIIFLTGKQDPESIAKGFQIGAQDYVTKPFNVSELKARVETQIDLTRKREALTRMNKTLEKKVKERTKELEHANRQLSGLNKAKSRFLELISHEMNTPVAVLLGFTEMLEEELKAQKYIEYIREIKQAVNRLRNFSEKAFLITMLQTKEYKIKKRVGLTVSGLIRNAADLCRECTEEKGLTINIDNCDVNIYGDIKLIQKCINGIIDNAVRYSPPKGVIQCTYDASDGMDRITINDQGPGFSEDALNYSFDLFALGEDPVKLNFGLHLATCKLIMKAHDGEIQIANSKHGGASVTLTLPAILKDNPD